MHIRSIYYRLSDFIMKAIFPGLIMALWYVQLMAQVDVSGPNKLSNEGQPDSLLVDQEIEASREIHRTAHDEDLEYQHAENAIESAMNSGSKTLYARALDNLGLLYRYHQSYNEAASLHVKAYDLIKNLEEPLSKMIYANNAGVAYRYGQEYDKAVLFYMHALKVAEEQNDLRNIAISCNGLGNTLLHIPNREEDAISYFERSLKAEQARENSLGMAMNYLSISDYYTQNKAYKKARKYLNKLLEINTERADEFGLAITYQYFGLNYQEEGKNLNKAENYFYQSLDLFQKLGNRNKQAELLKHLGDIAWLKREGTPAIEFYSQALDIAKEAHNKGLLMEIYADMSIVYERRGDVSKAFEFYKLSKAYNDSIALRDQEIEIAAIEKRFALEKKESQIALLEKDKIIQEALVTSQEETMRSQKFFLILLIIGFVAIGIIAMMQYRNIKIKKKSNQLLLHRNQQILSQRDEILAQKEEIERVSKQLERAFEEILNQQEKNEAKRIKLLESKFENKIQSLTLQSLESQMNPHFLFNGLNAVRWLVVQNKKEEAMAYLNTFAQLLRSSLTNNRKNEISLGEELKTTSLYLEIEKLRFNSEFVFALNIEPGIDVDVIMVPPKILQPLAENAIKHGLMCSDNPEKKLRINVLEKNGAVAIQIVDNGNGMKEPYQENATPKEDGTHLGLKLIQERLSIYNAQNKDQITFSIESGGENSGFKTGTTAEIKIIREPNLELVISE